MKASSIPKGKLFAISLLPFYIHLSSSTLYLLKYWVDQKIRSVFHNMEKPEQIFGQPNIRQTCLSHIQLAPQGQVHVKLAQLKLNKGLREWWSLILNL